MRESETGVELSITKMRKATGYKAQRPTPRVDDHHAGHPGSTDHVTQPHKPHQHSILQPSEYKQRSTTLKREIFAFHKK